MVLLIVFLIVLSIFGLIDFSYIWWKHSKNEPLVCSLHKNCDKVLQSKWAKMFGVRNEVLGFLFYLFIFVFGVSFLFGYGVDLVKSLLLWFSGAAVLVSVYFYYVQMKIIKEYCFYCLFSSLITILIFVTSLML